MTNHRGKDDDAPDNYVVLLLLPTCPVDEDVKDDGVDEEVEFGEFEEEGDMGGADEESVAQELAAELLSDDSVVDAFGAALAALGDVTRDGAATELADEEEAMGELEADEAFGAGMAVGEEGEGEGIEEEDIEIEEEGPLDEALVNEIALRVARRLLKRK